MKATGFQGVTQLQNTTVYPFYEKDGDIRGQLWIERRKVGTKYLFLPRYLVHGGVGWAHIYGTHVYRDNCIDAYVKPVKTVAEAKLDIAQARLAATPTSASHRLLREVTIKGHGSDSKSA